jgi:hypothetical protein
MAERRPRRRLPWGSLAIAVLCFALGLAVLILARPIDTSHVIFSPTPGAATLPPTAVPPTPTISPSPSLSLSPTATPAQ